MAAAILWGSSQILEHITYDKVRQFDVTISPPHEFAEAWRKEPGANDPHY